MSEAEDFEFRLRMEREAGAGASSAPPVKASMGDVIAGTPLARLAMGAASPLIGAAQLGAHVGDLANKAMGVEPVVSPWIDQKLKDYEEAKQRGMKASGTEGADVMGFLGQLAPSAAISSGVSKALPVATGLLERMGVGAVQGGAIAGSTPVTNTDEGFWNPKGLQTAIGAATGGTVPLVAEGVKKLGNLVQQASQPFTEKGRDAILQEFRDALMGRDPAAKAAMVKALQQAPPGVGGVMPTAGEVLADIPESTGLAAHQQAVSGLTGPSTQFARRAADQEAARASELVPIAQNEGALEGHKAIRNTITGPMREQALRKANAGTAAQLAREAVPTPQAMAQDALKSAIELHGVAPKSLQTAGELTQHGWPGDVPLRADMITRSIKSTAAQPGLRASDVVTKTLGDLKDKIAGLADERGAVDARDLYMVRKEAGNLVRKYAEESKNFDQRLTSGLVNNIQKSIDDAIEGAGGKGWKQYLSKYQELSGPINRMEAGQGLQKALTSPLETSERGQVFAKALRDTDISALTDQDRTAVQKVAEELSKKDAFGRLARQTKVSGSDAIPGQVGLPLPNLLSRPAMAANFILKHIGQSAEKKIAQKAAGQYLNPQELAAALKTVPPRYQPMIDALMKQAGTATVTGTARHF